MSGRARSRRWREVARTDAVAATASARCRMRVYTSRECTEAVSRRRRPAQDDDPLADIKAAWIMAGEDIKDFTVMKFNKKLREEEKRDFNKNFISGNTDYEEKIDLRISAF